MLNSVSSQPPCFIPNRERRSAGEAINVLGSAVLSIVLCKSQLPSYKCVDKLYAHP